ncbi:hypothetical protein IH601_00685 [Candidatus Bipolaricaulota bacterium]|nr:hypothetical protein [Candidatus Bipolaricaulota bacterium]TFH08617.1 MAG: hypothetical protein E4H08_07470 [Candidatus Atribacteria bacterium]
MAILQDDFAPMLMAALCDTYTPPGFAFRQCGYWDTFVSMDVYTPQKRQSVPSILCLRKNSYDPPKNGA